MLTRIAAMLALGGPLVASAPAQTAIQVAGSPWTHPPSITRGTLQNGVYHLNSISTEITVPPGWDLMEDRQAGKAENLFFMDRDSAFKVAMYVARLTAAEKAGDVDAWLRAMMDAKVQEGLMQGAAVFELLPETVRAYLVQGRHALSAVTRSSRGGVEITYGYLAYICGVESYVFALGRAPTGQVSLYRDRVERLIAGTKVP